MRSDLKILKMVLSQQPDLFLKRADFIASAFPSLSAAFNAYDQQRAVQNALAQQMDSQKYPGLNFNPQMAQMQQNMSYTTPVQDTSTPSSAPAPIHHRRHYHRHHHAG